MKGNTMFFLKKYKDEAKKLIEDNAKLEAKNKLMGENSELKQEVHDTKLELDQLKNKKKMEEEDIKHMVKINSERKDIELEKEKISLQGEQAKEIAQVKDEYRDKIEANLEGQLGKMDGMYKELLARLPNITAHIGDPVNKGK